jgi:hypothetical protein
VNDLTSETELLHGAALHKLVRGLERVTIENLHRLHPSLYLVQGIPVSAGVMLKLSTRGRTHMPRWHFFLTPNEEEALAKFHLEYPRARTFYGLVCRDDGVCCVSLAEVESILADDLNPGGKFLSVSRPRGASYHLRGPGRTELGHAIPQSDWPDALRNGPRIAG